MTAKIIRLGICNIICPLQKDGKDGKGCEEQFCSDESSQDKLDDYEGDYVDTSSNDVWYDIKKSIGILGTCIAICWNVILMCVKYSNKP